jgi:hypothetical protein
MRLAGALAVLAFGVVVAIGTVVLSCGDPVHNAEVAALGPENPDIPPGPTHRAGQPCLTCHGGVGPGNTTFVTAGTVYLAASSTDAGALDNGTVQLTDSTGSPFQATTNVAGNFYVTSDQWNPVFPIGGITGDAGVVVSPHVISISAPPCVPPSPCLKPATMATAIGRGGVYASCAYCHFDPPGPTTPGHVYQNPNL